MENNTILKDDIYKVFTEPTIENFRNLLKNNVGEQGCLEFKQVWIEDNHLSKEILAMANSGGGLIVLGVSENKDGSFNFDGLSELRDEANFTNGIGKYLCENLQCELYNYIFDVSEYEKLKGKKYQIIKVYDTPENLPFMAKKDGEKIKSDVVYIRKGSSCKTATKEELDKIIQYKTSKMQKANKIPLNLKGHLEELKVLYGEINKSNIHSDTVSNLFAGIFDNLSLTIQKNPSYPDENYETFIIRLILIKKNIIAKFIEI